MSEQHIEKDPLWYQLYLIFLLVGLCIMAIPGMFSDTIPTSEWKKLSKVFSLLFVLPILPRGYQVMKKKKGYSHILIFFIIVFLAVYTTFWAHVVLTRTLPTLLTPFFTNMTNIEMEVVGNHQGGRKVCRRYKYYYLVLGNKEKKIKKGTYKKGTEGFKFNQFQET